jgi:hypothetical protein
MAHPLAGVVEKLRRSDVHLQTLYENVVAYLNRTPVHLWSKRDLGNGEPGFLVKAVEQPPLMLSVIVGDVLHNLRSALDYLAHELIKRNGCTPTFQTQFPICATEKDFLNEAIARNRLGGISLRGFRTIDAFQPHHVEPEKLRLHQLWHLHKLSNLDKHKTLALAALASQCEWRYIDKDTGKIRRVDRIETPLRDGAIVGTTPREFLNPKFRIEATIACAVTFSEPPLVDFEVVNALQRIREFVGALMLPAFERLFDPLPDDLKLTEHGLPDAVLKTAVEGWLKP